ncbi:unnamed protein product [Calicophoron daubneyi]|uniref:Glutamate--cysteine ligase n=1 Tax=Calicophoron daubneyi TaxID=300641 RepID=A0AAV2TC97_CALDB
MKPQLEYQRNLRHSPAFDSYGNLFILVLIESWAFSTRARDNCGPCGFGFLILPIVLIKLMGLLASGVPLSWSDTKRYARYIQEEGIKEFIYLYRTLRSRTKYALKWGDEVEYSLVRFDPVTGEAQLLLAASELLKELGGQTNENSFIWQPEYAEYMIEGLPGRPFGQLLHAFSTVESNMRKRRQALMSHLPEGCCALSISVFPRLGCPNFTYPPAAPNPTKGASKSLFYPDAAINQGHPRFKTLTHNIRERRGSKVAINVPIYRDTQTPDPFVEDFSALHDGSDPDAASAALPNHVYMDAMGFGMGCSCLQITFQACCIDEARILYDQLATLCPIIMALSAASPAIRGYLVDTDCRWNIISASVDDRTTEERGLKPLQNDRFVIPKSRYDSISSYISPMGEAYNDLPLVYDPVFYNKLVAEGVDHLLAKHVAHLFIRDPISAFGDRLVPPPDEVFVEHFENIQSTNWQSMRFKPPPVDSSIGWRVEFRPTELQLTDFENAAFTTFILLLSRTILKLKLNLLIPLSKVDENMKVAIKRDASRSGRFYFRRGHLLTTDCSPMEVTKACAQYCCRSARPESEKRTSGNALLGNPSPSDITKPGVESSSHNLPEDSYTLMSMDEIMNGSDNFPGLIPLVRHYVDAAGGEGATLSLVHRYLDFLEQRASGVLKTTASWMRSRIMSHPDYKNDSRIPSSVNADLMRECWAITQGDIRPPDLLPSEDFSNTHVPNYSRLKCSQFCSSNGTEGGLLDPYALSTLAGEGSC